MKPCRHGHSLSERFYRNGQIRCRMCLNASARKKYHSDIEKYRAISRKSYAKCHILDHVNRAWRKVSKLGSNESNTGIFTD